MPRLLLAFIAALCFPATAIAADLEVSFADSAWGGGKIPSGQHCSKQGGKGATPAFALANVPSGTTVFHVEFNDRNYQPLSYDGGHGIIGFKHGGGDTAVLPSVPGETKSLPDGAWVEKKNRARGSFARDGYLPPCSNRRNHKYWAMIKAIDANGDVLSEAKITLGRY